MKSLRTLFLSCLAAALLAIPCSAQAWIFQTYDAGTGSYTTVPTLTFTQSVTSPSGLTTTSGTSYFRILANDSSPLAQAINVTRLYTYTGSGDTWSFSQRFTDIDAGKLLNRSGGGNVPGTITSPSDISTNTLYSLLLSTTANSSGSGPANSSVTATFTVNTVDTSKTPIPGTLLLLGPGIAGLAALRKRFKG